MEGLEDYDVFEDYTPNNGTHDDVSSAGLGTFNGTKSFLDYTLLTLNILISVVGLGGNAVIIWIAGFKMKKTVTTTWYLSLAISDFFFCACLPLEISYVVTSHWPFGLVLCKLTSSALFLNMFSSVFLLVLISMDRCVMILFPIWSHHRRTVQTASGVVVLMWALSAILTLPSLLYRQTKAHGSVTQCYTEYRGSRSRHKAVAVTRFVCGFLIPFLIIVCCCLILCMKLRRLSIKSTKPYKVMSALILSFFICWIPYHTFVLLEFDIGNHSVGSIQAGLKVGATLASANSLLNPVLYVFIGNDFKQTLKLSFMSRIENAMVDGGRTANPSRSKSVEM